MPIKEQGRSNTAGPAKMMCVEIRYALESTEMVYERD